MTVCLDQVVDNSTRPNNGIVTMKGKGDVQTWVPLPNFAQQSLRLQASL